MRTVSEKKARKWTRASEGRGFTLAETLIAVALIGVMAAIAFVGVLHWRKTLKQLEYDSKAKEIYVAAQNHLTLAESQGLLESTTFNYGEPEKSGGSSSDPTGIHYIVYSGTVASGSMLDIILPFGSIDENVRAGGSYIIRYQPDIAVILDVFYTEDVKLSNDDYASLKGFRGDDKKSDRQGFQAHNGKAIVGYYGGDSDGAASVKLKAPSVQVQNGDTLKVIVSYPEANNEYDYLSREGAKPGAELKLIVEELDFTGKSTSTKRSITLKKSDTTLYTGSSGQNEIYEITLDDVTTAGVSLNTISWGDGLTNPPQFVAGRNLKIYAKVQSTANAKKDGKDVIAIAKSNEVETNQSFAQTAKVESGVLKVEISSFRHLANLSNAVSGFKKGTEYTSVAANQTTDISWARFTKSISNEHYGDDKHASDTVIVCADGNASKAGTFLPVNPSTDYALVYDGLKTKTEDGVTTATAHRISLVEVEVEEANGSAGIFGVITGSGSEIKNLVVVNAQVTATGTGATAGALVGTLSDHAKVSNVLARTTLTSTGGKYADKYADRGVTSTGTAGGLVGTVDDATVTDSAAAVYVKATAGTAGGLVGSAEDSAISRSYSSAHILNDTGAYDRTKVDVDARGAGTAGVAGGLLGSASNTTITSCYSTCAAGNASEVGGLVGHVALGSTGSISDCYVTGLVTNPTTKDSNNKDVLSGSVGAFIGTLESGSLSKLTNDHYYKVTNGSDVKPVGNKTEEEGAVVSPFDEMTYSNGAWSASSALNTYFTTSSSAVPYNQTLAKRYNGIYAFKTIDSSTSTLATPAFTDHLTRHYGDWPAYDVLFVNRDS